MKDPLDVDVRGVFVDHGTRIGLILLGAGPEPSRVLPIVIGPTEAEAIAIGLSSEPAPRPMTHDLLLRTIRAARGEVVRVDIVDLIHDTFVAEIEMVLSDRVVRLDARPSDGIAVAVRTGVPIGVDPTLFERAAVAVRSDAETPFAVDEIEEIIDEFKRFLDRAEPRDFSLGDHGDGDPAAPG
jgi:bifunctional DNase/RNase